MKFRVRGVYSKRKKLASGAIVEYWYHRKTGCRIPHPPGTLEFLQFVNNLNTNSGRTLPGPRSICALIRDYKQSVEFKKLEGSTQKEYLRHTAVIEKIVGRFDVDKITLDQVAMTRNKFADKPSKSNGIGRMFSALLSYAVSPKGWITSNPCRKLAMMPVGSGQAPYLEAEIARFRNANPYGSRARLAFELCLSTALRISDTVRVTADQLREMLIYIHREKTGIPILAIPTEELRRAFEAWEAACLKAEEPIGRYALGTTAKGGPRHKRTISADLEAAYEAAGFTKAQRTHALRYTAAIRLFEEGFHYDDIAEVTGHAMADMARKYCEKKRNARKHKAVFDRYDDAGVVVEAG